MPAYVLPADLIDFFENDEILQATNLFDVSANQVNTTKLQKACDGANGFAYGYLATRYADEQLQPESLNPGFLQAFKVHCLHVARYLLDSSSEEIQAKYQEAKEYFQWMAEGDRMSRGDTTPGITPTEAIGSIAYGFNREPAWDNERLTSLFG